jgi:hypothetical protein
MTVTVEQHAPIEPAQVFAVLADGWSYAGWVVGNSHIRSVDDGWPAKGTRIHHSAGAWPVQLEDTTSVVDVEPGRDLLLEAHLWHLGNARIRFTLTPDGSGTRVVMAEELVSGPAGVLPEPVQAVLLRGRNRETLRRLCDLAVGRAG